MSGSFVHLHVHTEYSMLDGAAKVAPLFARARELAMPAVAITDHGNMFGAAEFYRQSLGTGVKPIIGIEAYVAPESRHVKRPVFWGQRGGRNEDESSESGDVSGRGAFTHMTMLAADATGLRNLFRLSSLASIEGQYKKPRMDRELIAAHARGIIATTGCPGGEVPTRLRLGQFDEAVAAAGAYRDIFGPGNYFVELMDHGITMERTLRTDLLRLAAKLNLPTVVTNDSHYVTPDQAGAHGALLCVQTGRTLTDPNRFKFDGDGYYLKSADEMRGFWDREVPGACDTTLTVAERVGPYDEVFAPVDRMPKVDVPAGKTEADLLRDEVERYIPTRFHAGLPSDEYRERIEWELRVICSKGYASYFLVVGDLVRWAKAQGIRVGPGRGSATGALVSYILHIINLDPIEHALIFERFLNPERDSPPDIDLDFDERRREEVAGYVRAKYGAENFAQVITFGTIKTKAAIKDAARAHFGQPGYAVADRITKALPPPVAAKDIPLSGIVDPQHPRYPEAAEVRALIESNPEINTIFETARGLEGLIRNAGVHACAHILSSEPLLDVLPLWMRPDGSIITGWDYEPCEAIGLLKMDLLGLSTLTIIDDAIRAVKTNHGVDIDLDTLALDDQAAYVLLARGDTLGVFQLDGGGMRTLLKAMIPTHFGDVSAALALYRPVPMAVNAHMDYAARSNGRAPINPIHPELKDALDPILGESYHLLVYQEQVMAIAQQLAGYTLGEADLLRKAMGKKKPEVIARESEKFLGGMQTRGFSAKAAATLWEVMLPFAGYAFNKSHTAGYALVSYWTAYLKAHYPAEFMAAQLTSNADNKDKSAIYLAECRRMNIRVLPPDVNESQVAFSAVAGNIRFGLGAVRNVGISAAESIIRTRTQKRPYASFADFLRKVDAVVCNKKVVESMIKAGAFDSLGATRKALCTVHEEAIEAMSTLKRHEAMGQFDLFDSTDDAGPEGEDTSPLAHLRYDPDEWPRQLLLAYERDMLGLYVSAHPLDGTQGILRKHAPKPIATLVHDAPREGEVVIAGLIASVDRRVNKKGEPWAIVVIEDLDTAIEVLFFAKSYAMMHEELLADGVVAVKGRVNWRDDTMSLFASGLVTLDTSGAAHQPTAGAPFTLRANARQLTTEHVIELRTALAAHRGPTPVHIVVCGTHEIKLLIPDYSVTVSGALVGEIKSIKGIMVETTTL